MKDNLKVAVAELMLGYTRVQGLVVYNSASKEFNEVPPAQAKRLITAGELYGVKYKDTEDGIQFYCDEDFSQEDILIKTACGKYRSMNNEIIGSSVLNSIYTVVKKVEYTDKSFYEIVGTKCSRLMIAEENLVELNKISHVAGCWISENGDIQLHDAIPVVKRDISYNSNIIEVDVNIPTNKVVEPAVEAQGALADLFNVPDQESEQQNKEGFEATDLQEPTPEEMKEAFSEMVEAYSENNDEKEEIEDKPEEDEVHEEKEEKPKKKGNPLRNLRSKKK